MSQQIFTMHSSSTESAQQLQETCVKTLEGWSDVRCGWLCEPYPLALQNPVHHLKSPIYIIYLFFCFFFFTYGPHTERRVNGKGAWILTVSCNKHIIKLLWQLHHALSAWARSITSTDQWCSHNSPPTLTTPGTGRLAAAGCLVVLQDQ